LDCKIDHVQKLHEKLLKDGRIKGSNVVLKHIIICPKNSKIENMKKASKANNQNAVAQPNYH
jgi:hypothetical protein